MTSFILFIITKIRQKLPNYQVKFEYFPGIKQKILYSRGLTHIFCIKPVFELKILKQCLYNLPYVQNNEDCIEKVEKNKSEPCF